MNKIGHKKRFEETLHKLEELFLADKGVIGAFYCGSIADGTYDEYSDIDLILIVRENDQSAVFKQMPKILSESIGLKSAVDNEGKGEEWCCLVTDDYIGLDLPVWTKADLMPSRKFSKIRILKDYRQMLAVFKQKSGRIQIKFNDKEFNNIIEDIVNAQLYTARHLMRGWRTKAACDIHHIGDELYHWLISIKCDEYHPPDLRDAEKLLTPKEMILLSDSRPKNSNTEEIRRAMGTLSEFTCYVVKTYERKFGRISNISSENKSFNEYVESVFRGDKF